MQVHIIFVTLIDVFSYLDSVKPLVSHDLYQLGIKEYLLGNVLEYTSLQIRFWREYTVLGKTEYQVIIPLLHILTTPDQHKEVNITLEKTCRCSCAYYKEVGICKHIVAVCAALDRELKAHIQLTQEGDIAHLETTPLLNNLLEFDQANHTALWMEKFEYYFSLTQNDDPNNLSVRRMFDVIRDAFARPDNAFANTLRTMLQEKVVKDLVNAERFLQLALFWRAYLVGGAVWMQIVLQTVALLSEDMQVQFWSEFWQEFVVMQSSLHESREIIRDAASTLSQSLKLKITYELDQKSHVDALEFATFSLFQEYIQSHLSELNIEQLVALLSIFPESVDDIEYFIHQQIIEFAHYVTSKDQALLLTYLNVWKQKRPDSFVLHETAKEIAQLHAKKRNLITQLKKY